jgi:hypothetical protein
LFRSRSDDLQGDYHPHYHPKTWQSTCRSTRMIERYSLILVAVLMACSIGVFFLFVPILPAIGIAAVVIGLGAMFGLGYYVGRPQTDAVVPDEDESIAITESSVDTVRLTDELVMHR